ncbi:helix-turn-helix domain-containing protein [Romboutsia sp.]|uniref:helix-turn-helix domain-containing protein n=1 Tax=Romboutsia sp. TaxID=1965302 RepID=UPI003F40227E
MTEFFKNFSAIYNLQFMSIPSIKTLIIISTTIVYFAIQKNVFEKELKLRDYIILILFVFSLFIVPLVLHGALMVWSYYLPYQLITIYLGLVGLKYLKDNPNLLEEISSMRLYKAILIYTLIFSILIIIEDTVVIFSFDVYSHLLVKINNRSISEDILSMIYAVFAIKYCTKNLNVLTTSDIEVEGKNNILNTAFSDKIFYEFSKHSNLTKREQEVFKLIIENKNNKEISEELFISIGTVKTHIHNIFQKVNVDRRNQLLIKYKDFQNKTVTL